MYRTDGKVSHRLTSDEIDPFKCSFICRHISWKTLVEVADAGTSKTELRKLSIRLDLICRDCRWHQIGL